MTDEKLSKQTFYLLGRYRRALASYAGSKGLTIGEAIQRLIDNHLPEFLVLADKEDDGNPPPPQKPGRRPKSAD